MENTERYIDAINTSVFFKEFTFGKELYVRKDNQELELADNIVWLDDLFIVFQIKERQVSEESRDFEKWFKDKVLKKAVKQVKNSVKILAEQNELKIKNNRGHERQFNVNRDNIRKVVLYNPNEVIDEKLRMQKFHESKEVGLIHLFHIEDYYWICKYLITPTEISRYLLFREEFQYAQKLYISLLPEQYILGHFLSGYEVDHIDLRYIENIKKLNDDVDSFDLGFYLSQFGDKVKLINGVDEYYLILEEIVKLNRNELREFKKRFMRLFERCKEDELYDPNRMTLSSGCGFIFLALPKGYDYEWENALKNYTLIHKYEQKIDKCIGVVVYSDGEWFEIFWCYTEFKWEYDEEQEKILKQASLNEVKIKNFSGYDLNATKI